METIILEGQFVGWQRDSGLIRIQQVVGSNNMRADREPAPVEVLSGVMVRVQQLDAGCYRILPAEDSDNA